MTATAASEPQPRASKPPPVLQSFSVVWPEAALVTGAYVESSLNLGNNACAAIVKTVKRVMLCDGGGIGMTLIAICVDNQTFERDVISLVMSLILTTSFIPTPAVCLNTLTSFPL